MMDSCKHQSQTCIGSYKWCTGPTKGALDFRAPFPNPPPHPSYFRGLEGPLPPAHFNLLQAPMTGPIQAGQNRIMDQKQHLL